MVQQQYYQGPYNGTPLKVVTIVLPVIASGLVLWRISWRAWNRLLGLSDYLLMIGWALALCLAGLNLDPYFRWGYGYKKDDIPPEILGALTPKICFYLNQIFFKATAGSIKLSICAIYMGIFRNPVATNVNIARYCNFALMFTIGCYYVGGTLVSTFQCDPIQKAYLDDLEGKCIDNSQFRVANAVINSVTSVLLVCLPFPALLMMERRNKEIWQFLALIGLGLIHTACAVYRVVQMYLPNPQAYEGSPDPHWENTMGNVMGMTEIFVGVIVATIITMRPCFQAVGIKVFDTVSNATNLRSITGGETKQGSRGSRILTLTTASRRDKVDREGFNQIAVTTEIELETRDRSTEDLFDNNMRPTYHPGK